MEGNYYFRNCTWKDKPDVVMIEIANSCNFRCVMCSNKFMTRKKGFMAFEVFKRTLDACKDAGIKNLKLYTTGESLLHPQFLEFFKFADTYPFDTIMISTNGSLLEKELIDELLKSEKVRIQISFSGPNKRSYEQRYIGGNYEDIREKIIYLNEQIRKLGLEKNILKINGVAPPRGGFIKHTKEFIKREFSLDESQLSIHNQNNWVKVFSQKSGEDDDKRHYCHIANTRIGVLYDGRVTACGCLDVNGELVVGDINKEDILEIRKGKLFKEFTGKLGSGKVSGLMCSRCDSLKIIK